MNKIYIFITFYCIITILFAISTFTLSKNKYSNNIILNKILTLILTSTCMLYIIIYNLLLYFQIGIFLSALIIISFFIFDEDILDKEDLLKNKKSSDFKDWFLTILFFLLFWPQFISFFILNLNSLLELD